MFVIPLVPDIFLMRFGAILFVSLHGVCGFMDGDFQACGGFVHSPLRGKLVPLGVDVHHFSVFDVHPFPISGDFFENAR